MALFCAVTLFIWGNRIWLAWTNPDDTVAEKLVWSTPIRYDAEAVGLAARPGLNARTLSTDVVLMVSGPV